MRPFRRLRLLGCALGLCAWGAAACTSVVPEALRGEVDRQLTYDQIARDPAAHRGRMIVTGGEVLRAEPRGADLELVLIERPLSALDESPILAVASRGELLVQLPAGARSGIQEGQVVTMVGSVLGAGTTGSGLVPFLQARHIHVWPVGDLRFRPDSRW